MRPRGDRATYPPLVTRAHGHVWPPRRLRSLGSKQSNWTSGVGLWIVVVLIFVFDSILLLLRDFSFYYLPQIFGVIDDRERGFYLLGSYLFTDIEFILSWWFFHIDHAEVLKWFNVPLIQQLRFYWFPSIKGVVSHA